MKKINKKIIYGLGSVLVVSTPLIATLSCGDTNPPEENQLKLDGKVITSAKELITTLDSKMHFIMKKPSTIIGKPGTNPLGYPLSNTQYQEIANGVITDITFKLTYGDKSQTFSTHFNSDTIIVKNEIENVMLKDQTQIKGDAASKRVGDRSRVFLEKAVAPNFIGYVSSLTMLIGSSSSGLLSLTDTAWSAYLHELTEWTNFASEINNSSVYKAWLTKNPDAYLLPKKDAATVNDPTKPNNGQILKADLINPTLIDNKKDKGATGINFDDTDKKELLTLFTMSQPKQIDKTNNLAAQFDYMIQNLFDFN